MAHPIADQTPVPTDEQREEHKWARKTLSSQPKYNGSTSYRRWVYEWEAHLNAQGINEAVCGALFMKRAVIAAMTGLATDMIQPYREGTDPWKTHPTRNDYLEVLREVFEPASEIHLARETFKMLKQGAKDDVSTYITKKFSLYTIAYPVPAEQSFNVFFNEIVRGMHSQHVKRYMYEHERNIVNLDQLRERAYTGTAYYRKLYMEGMTETVSSLDGLMPTNALAKAGFKDDTSQAMEIDALKEEINALKVGGKKDVKCFNCNKTGHMAKDCWSKKKTQGQGQGKGGGQNPKPKFKGKCGYCKKEGHKEAECYAKKRDKGGKTTPSQGKGSQRVPPQRVRNMNDDEEDFLEDEGPLVEEE